MNIDRIEKSKGLIDLFTFIFMLIWIGLRVLEHMNVGDMQITLHIVRLFVVIGVMLVIMHYVFFSKLFTDELEKINKLKAHKLSWVITGLSSILLYIISDKTSLSAKFSIELIMWVCYLSYFISYKFLEAGLDSKFSEKQRQIISTIAVFIGMVVFGMIFGYMIPHISSEVIMEHKYLYIVSAIVAIILTGYVIISFVKMAIVVEKEQKRSSNV